MTTATIRRLGFVALVIGALCAPTTAALALAPAPRLPPGIGVKLLQGPADSLDNPRAHEYIVDHLAPGTTISRQIGVSNGEAQPVYLSFYAVGADIRNGIFEPGTGHAPNDLASWTTFSPTTATVQPGQTLAVMVTVAVPSDATAGERYAAALADDTPPPAGSGSGSVVSVSRVGIRIYLSVGAGGAPKTAFTINSMTAGRDARGQPLVTAMVDNTGGRAVDLSGQLELANGPSSLSAGPFPVRTVATLAPGQSGQVSVVLDPDLPNGPWDAKLTLVSGLTSEAGTARITFPTARFASAAPAVTAALPRNSGVSPLVAGALAFGAMALLCVLVLLWHRQRLERVEVGHELQVPRSRAGVAATSATINARSPDHPPKSLTLNADVVVTRSP